MRKALFALAIAFGASGCTSMQYGNYSAAPVAFNKAMATDTATHLSKLYPPALTRWNMAQQSDDAYGIALIAALRARGYSVSEYAPDSGRVVQAQGTSHLASNQSVRPGVELRYVVDSLAPTAPLYRVTVLMGTQAISRAYIPQKGGTVIGAGSWARKE